MSSDRSESKLILFYNGPFSQWYPSAFTSSSIFASPDVNPVKTYKFANCEQYMMFEKAILFQDLDTAKSIMSTSNPRTIKALGREVTNFEEKTWNAYREMIVYHGNLCKFSQSPHLKTFLLETRNATIAEASPYDKIWGIGLGETHPAAKDPKKWKGLNLLGVALMKVRDTLRNVEQN